MGRNGTGVRPASESSIEITFPYRGERCRERIKLKPTPANLKRAERHRAAILLAIENGTFDYAVTFPDSPRASKFCAPDQIITLEHYLDRWLERVRPGLKSSTYATHRRIVRRINQALGGQRLSDLRWRNVREWIESQDVGQKTARNLLSVLRSALKDAVDDDIMDANPLADRTIRRTTTTPATDEIDPFNAEERAAILAAADGQERNFIQFALWTGLRSSELCALDWSDVDLRNGVVRVTKALTQDAKEAEIPKTAAGRRDVKLLEPALAALLAQRPHTELFGAAVFHNPRTDQRWPGDLTFRQGAWKRILRRAGVRYRYPYQLRHTYASMMLMAGEAPQWVATQLGHKDWAFTMRTYARWIASDTPNAGDKAVYAWGKREKKLANTLSLRTKTDHK